MIVYVPERGKSKTEIWSGNNLSSVGIKLLG
jgi:hypothetical protein